MELYLAVSAAMSVPGGVVFGMSNTVVTPPRMAPRVPLARSSTPGMPPLPAIAEMYMRVDDAGQDCAGRRRRTPSARRTEVFTDRGDAAGTDADIGFGQAPGQHDGAVSQQGGRSSSAFLTRRQRLENIPPPAPG